MDSAQVSDGNLRLGAVLEEEQCASPIPVRLELNRIGPDTVVQRRLVYGWQPQAARAHERPINETGPIPRQHEPAVPVGADAGKPLQRRAGGPRFSAAERSRLDQAA